MKPGVYETTRKNGDVYYRGNITYKGKHISIGSYNSEAMCNAAYNEARDILKDDSITLLSYQNKIKSLPFEKVVILINYRDNNIYIKNPTYLTTILYIT